MLFDISTIIYRYYKLGVSTQKESDLDRRPNTYARYSEFLQRFPIQQAKSTQHGKKYETFLFKLLQVHSTIQWVYGDDKNSNRGVNILYNFM